MGLEIESPHPQATTLFFDSQKETGAMSVFGFLSERWMSIELGGKEGQFIKVSR